MPWQAVQLVLVALLTWAVCALYTLRLNPEVAFYRHGAVVKRGWVQKLDHEHKSKFLIYGGSSCAFAIDGERMWQKSGLPMANLGLGAGMGAKVLTEFALQALRTGDTLIVALEPDLLTGKIDLEPLGVQFSLATGNPGLLQDRGRMEWLAALLELRPGSYHFFTLLGKIVSRQPLHRYSHGDFQPSGWQRAVARRQFSGPPPLRPHLSIEGRNWLAYIRDECARRGVRVAYALPWGYCPVEKLENFQRVNRTILREISEFIPVLKDTRLGAHTVQGDYADTEWHLTAEGAALRTDDLAQQIQSWRMWSRSELQ